MVIVANTVLHECIILLKLRLILIQDMVLKGIGNDPKNRYGMQINGSNVEEKYTAWIRTTMI